MNALKADKITEGVSVHLGGVLTLRVHNHETHQDRPNHPSVVPNGIPQGSGGPH
jgi:hypothetical protein